jgi:MYXO-CTERM domain-containing protein
MRQTAQSGMRIAEYSFHMQYSPKSYLVGAIVALSLTASASATNILLSSSGGTLGYGYGYSQWDNMTAALNTASGNGVTVTSNFTNLAQMLAADALWLDQRWTSGSLSGTELTNLSTFISTGKRVVMIGENSNWTAWDNQILGLVGGSFAGDGFNTATTIYSHALTAGVTSTTLPGSGLSTVSGGTALFDQNWATLWGANQNVLTLLDINVMSDSNWSDANNAVFANNVAQWISATPQNNNVPEGGSTVAMMGLAALALAGARRKFRA